MKKGNIIWNGIVAGFSHLLSDSSLFCLHETYHSNGSFSISGGEGGQASPTAGILCRPDSITGWLYRSLPLMGLTFLICIVRSYIVSMVFSSVDTVYDLQGIIS